MKTRCVALVGVCLLSLLAACGVDPAGDCNRRCETRRTSRCLGFRGEEDCGEVCAGVETEYAVNRDAALDIGCEAEFDALYACSAAIPACDSSAGECAAEQSAYGTCQRTVCERMPTREECIVEE